MGLRDCGDILSEVTDNSSNIETISSSPFFLARFGGIVEKKSVPGIK